SYPLRQLGHFADARKRLDTAFAGLRQLKLYPAEQIEPGSEASYALRALADYEATAGKVRRAAELYQELIGRLPPVSSEKAETLLEDAVAISNVYGAAGPLYRSAGQADAAGSLEARRIELWQRWSTKLPNNAFVRGQLQAAHSR